MQDKRLTHRLTEYWNNLRGEESLPDWEGFDPTSFMDVWQQCCGWKVDSTHNSTIVYKYEYMGDSVKEMVGMDFTGKSFTSYPIPSGPAAENEPASPEKMLLNHFRDFPAARIMEKIDRVTRKPAIVIEEGRVTDGKGKNVRFRSCLLPFGTEDGQITHMVLGLSWKTF